MTKKLSNVLILEEGVNKIIVKRAGATHDVGIFNLIKTDNDNYYLHYAENLDAENNFCFRSGEFWNGQNSIK